MKKLVCSECGSDALQLVGWVRWNYSNQQFIFESLEVICPVKHLENQYAICGSCDNDGTGIAVWEEYK